MTTYDLKTPANLYPEKPVTPQGTDILLAWQDGSFGACLRSEVDAYLRENLGIPDAVQDVLDEVVGGAPGTLDTLGKIATALGDDPDYATNVTADLAGKQPIDAHLTALAGLTGAPGSFVRWTGAATAVMQAIVGTVSQSDGTPTGAIVEQGANANGRYVRLASGLQICWHTRSTLVTTNTALGAIYYAPTTTFTFPAAFAAVPLTLPLAAKAGEGFAGGALTCWGIAASSSPTTAALEMQVVSPSAAGLAYPAYVAIGRWF